MKVRYGIALIALALGLAAALLYVSPSANDPASKEPSTADSRTKSGAVGRIPASGGDGVDLSSGIGKPCLIATQVGGLNEVIRLTDIPVYASASVPVTRTWMCGGTPVVMYGPIQVTYETGWDDLDVAAKFRALAEDLGGEVVTIQGRSAYVHPATPEGPRSGVMLVVDGTLVRMLAEKDVSTNALVALAKTLKLPEEAPATP